MPCSCYDFCFLYRGQMEAGMATGDHDHLVEQRGQLLRELAETSATSAKDHSGHSTANAASPTATARAMARRDTAPTGC